MNESFLELLKIAIGESCRLEHDLGLEEWEEIVDIARKQAMLGIIYQAMLELPKDQTPPFKIRARLSALAEIISQRNKRLNEASAKLTEELDSMGMPSCLLKGQGLARFYANPQWRQCGDIDIWVNGEAKSVLDRISSKWKVSEVWYHHADIHPFEDKIEVELHFHPSWMNNPFANRRLQRLFDESFPTQAAHRLPELGFNVPTVEFDLFYNLLHIYRHILLEGVGLKQVLDYYHILKNSTEQQRLECAKLMKSFHMQRFSSGLMYVLHQLFDLDASFHICAESESYGNFLLEQIFKGGNFGRYDSRNHYRDSKNYFQKAVSRLRHLVRYIFIAPDEVLWAPYFKLLQFVWKRKNHYL